MKQSINEDVSSFYFDFKKGIPVKFLNPKPDINNRVQQQALWMLGRMASSVAATGDTVFDLILALKKDDAQGPTVSTDYAPPSRTNICVITTGTAPDSDRHFPVLSTPCLSIDKPAVQIVRNKPLTVTGWNKIRGSSLLIPKRFWLMSHDHIVCEQSSFEVFPSLTEAKDTFYVYRYRMEFINGVCTWWTERPEYPKQSHNLAVK